MIENHTLIINRTDYKVVCCNCGLSKTVIEIPEYYTCLRCQTKTKIEEHRKGIFKKR